MNWKLWWLELAALAASLFTVTGLAVLLAVFDRRSVFSWLGITLNSIIAVISVILKSFLAFAISECIGQWKWIVSAREGRQLVEFEHIDMATRGPIGALTLIWRKPTPLVLRFGVLTLLLNLVLDPFSQQLVKVEQGFNYVDRAEDYNYNKYNKTQRAIIAKADTYGMGKIERVALTNSTIDPGGPRMETVMATASLSMQAAILNGLSQPAYSIRQNVDVNCPTGNCTWSAYQTLGVCHRCNDVTKDLRRVDNFGEFFNVIDQDEYSKGNVTAHTLPNGHFIANINECQMHAIFLASGCYFQHRAGGMMNGPEITMTSFSTGNPNKTHSMKKINTLISSTSVIYLDSVEQDRLRDERDKISAGNSTFSADKSNVSSMYWPTAPLRATECALYYCVKSIQSSVVGNIIDERVDEIIEAVRDPKSWKSKRGREGFAPENFPSESKISENIEFDPFLSAVKMTNLGLYFSDKSSSHTYNITDNAVKAVSSHFQGLLMDAGTNTTKYQKLVDGLLGIKSAAAYNGFRLENGTYPIGLSGVWSGEDIDIKTTFEMVATSMTNEIRRSANYINEWDVGMMNDTSTMYSDPAIGNVMLLTTFYRSVWYWISVHGFLCLSSFSFCFYTMAYCSRRSKSIPVWKNSSLPVMRQGGAVANILQGARTVEEMQRRAQNEFGILLSGNKAEVLVDSNTEYEEMELDHYQHVNQHASSERQ